MTQLESILAEALAQFAPGATVHYLKPYDYSRKGAAQELTLEQSPRSYEVPLCLYIPPPESPSCLFIGLHEIGHVKCKFESGLERELHASAWARGFMEGKSIAVPEAIWQAALINSHNYDGNVVISSFIDLFYR